MAVKHVFIPFDAFRAQVLTTEVGVIAQVAAEYLKGLADQYHPCGQRYRDMMYLPYPFQVSYTAHVIDSCDIRDEINEKYTAWAKEHASSLTEDTQLPVFCDHEHNFGEMKRSRLDTLLANAITVEEYEEQGDAPILINADRDNYIYVDVHHEMLNSAIVVFRTNSPLSFVRRMRDPVLQSDHILFQTPWSRDPTSGATNGKILVGGPWTHHGPVCSEWLVRIDNTMIEEFRDRTGETLNLEIPLIDFGDFDAYHVSHCRGCANFENCDHDFCNGFIDPNLSYADQIDLLANPIDRSIGNIKGECIHRGTTTYVTMWSEY